MTTLKKTLALVLCAGCLAFTVPAVAAASTPTIEEMQTTIVSLQKQIAQILTLLNNRFQNSGNGNGNSFKLGQGQGDLGQGIYGEVTADNGDTLTVEAKKNAVTSETVDYTVTPGENVKVVKVTNDNGDISEENIDFEDIAKGDTIFVRGEIDGTSITADKVRVGDAAWNNFDDNGGIGVRGTASEDGDSDSVTITVNKPGMGTGTEFTVTAASGGVKIVKVSKTSGTKLTKDTNAGFEDIQKGDAVMVSGTVNKDDKTIEAVLIRFGDITGKGNKNGFDRAVSGKVTKAGDDSITIKARGNGKDSSYVVSEGSDCTIIKVARGTDGKMTQTDIKMSAIAVDDTVWITGAVNDTDKTIEATQIRVGLMGWLARGSMNNGQQNNNGLGHVNGGGNPGEDEQDEND
jgi:hypothetical protein